MKASKAHQSEFEIQSRLLFALREALGTAYLVQGEVTYKSCRFDLAIFDAASMELLCTIETKKRDGNRNGKWATVNQINRYQRRTGKPCILITDRNADQVISALKREFTQRRDERGLGPRARATG